MLAGCLLYDRRKIISSCLRKFFQHFSCHFSSFFFPLWNILIEFRHVRNVSLYLENIWWENVHGGEPLILNGGETRIFRERKIRETQQLKSKFSSVDISDLPLPLVYESSAASNRQALTCCRKKRARGKREQIVSNGRKKVDIWCEKFI